MPVFRADVLRRVITRILSVLGSSELEASVVAEHLVDAEMAGVGSHGVIRVPQYVQAVRDGKVRPQACMTVVREFAATAALDGGRGFGQVMARRAMDKAMELADRAGAGVVTLANCGHTGRIGSYTEHAARLGMIGITMVNAGGHGQWVAPFCGTSGRLATNPISIAVPASGEFPLVLDIATSVAPEGKIRARMMEGLAIPEGWVIKHDGGATTDPADLYGPPPGALLPFGGHKGYGLALLVDALAGGLSGAGCCTGAAPLESQTDGVFCVAIKPDAFIEHTVFLEQIRALVLHVKSSPRLAGSPEVLVPGETEARERSIREREGIPIDIRVWQMVEATFEEVTGVKVDGLLGARRP